MIETTLLGLLDVSAASGLVADGDRLYVVADDLHEIIVYDRRGTRLSSVPVFAEALPSDPDARKEQKADLEVLARLPGDRLFALGSGSAPRRRRGAVIDLAKSAARELDALALFESLSAQIPALNLEGAAVVDGRLRLLHRGNGHTRTNAFIDLALAPLLSAIHGGHPLSPSLVERIVSIDLGGIAGVPYTFTDASPLEGGALLFSAAAEDTDDPYLDGPCIGSVLGVLDGDGRVRAIEPIAGTLKIEGIQATVTGHEIEVLLVADADDPNQRAPLLAARLHNPLP